MRVLISQDGAISFLEVNTRLQVEHPVSEEVTGLDLVREQFHIAEGKELSYSDPEILGHSIEFRINGEDAGNGFLPAPGPIHQFIAPSGPGVRVDSGVVSGDVISGKFDSMMAKLIVTGKDRTEALARSRRALAEMQVLGLPTVLPFHRELSNTLRLLAMGLPLGFSLAGLRPSGTTISNPGLVPRSSCPKVSLATK